MVIKIEQAEIINIDIGLISEGIELKKYISSGNKLMLKNSLRNCLKFSTYIEKVIPKIIPKIVAEVPIITPTKKKIFIIDLLRTPIDLSIAISFVFGRAFGVRASYYCRNNAYLVRLSLFSRNNFNDCCVCLVYF